jgi:hypothetical protein
MEIVVLLKKFELANPTDQITLCTKLNAEITFYEITGIRLDTAKTPRRDINIRNVRRNHILKFRTV